MTEPTLEGFRDFCASKPADEAYDYYNIVGCALYQYGKAIGLDIDSAGNANLTLRGGANIYLLPTNSETVGEAPWTFGALTDRLTARLRSSGEAA